MVLVPLVGFVVSWLPGVGDAWRHLAAAMPDRLAPHTWLTYPATFPGFSVFELLGLVWLFFVSRMVERLYGVRGLVVALAFGAAVPAALSYLCNAWAPAPVLHGTYIVSTMLTALAAARDPRTNVMLFGVARLSMMWIGVLAIAALVVNYGAGDPLRGLVLAAPAGLFWLFGSGWRLPAQSRQVQSGRGGLAKSPKEFEDFLDRVRDREQARKEEEALKRLFEGPSAEQDEPNDPKT